MTADGKYIPYIENKGEDRVKGEILVNENIKTFEIAWSDGDKWAAKYKVKETKSEVDQLLGEVSRTYYYGNWTDDKSDCVLIITTVSNGCMYMLKSQKVVDKTRGIDTWKKNLLLVH